MSARYLGSLPETSKSTDSETRAATLAATAVVDIQTDDKSDDELRSLLSPFKAPEVGMSRHIDLKIADSDPRALCLISGTSPNTWGIDNKGRDIREAMGILPLSETDLASSLAYQKDFSNLVQLKDLNTNVRRAQPLWSAACLAVLQEMINRRLFSQV